MAFTDQDPQDILSGFFSGNTSANDPVKLAGLRKARMDELETHINQADSPSAAHVLQGYLEQLRGDAKSDPYTGDIAHQHEQDTENALATAALDERPEIKRYHDAALADKIALATAPAKVQGETTLANTRLQGAQAIEQLQQQQAPGQQYLDQMSGGAGGNLRPSFNTKGEMSLGAAAPPSQQERAMSDSAHSVNLLGQQALPMLEQLYPGISQNPDAHSSIFDTVAPQIGGWFYSHGAAPATSSNPGLQSNLNQVIGAIQASATKAMLNGRMTEAARNFVQKHLPDMTYSPGENYRRIQTLMTTIDPALLGGITGAETGAPLAMPLSQGGQ